MAKGKGKARASGETSHQGKLEITQYKLLKNPLSQKGKTILVRGDFWEGRMTAGERAATYQCHWS